MKKQKFIRTDSHKYSKLGRRRKKKIVYRKSKGRDNKIRLNMKGHLRNVRVGFRKEKSKRKFGDYDENCYNRCMSELDGATPSQCKESCVKK